MKNKTAKFIALLLAVFIFPLSFSACKSGNTELSAESVADICIENRQVWEFGENSVGNCGYCFIDLDLTHAGARVDLDAGQRTFHDRLFL